MMTERMLLAEDCSFSMDPRETGLNNNVLVVGGTGCGKTMSVSEPCLLETVDSSLVVTVTKRRLVRRYTDLFRRRGFQVLDLDLVRPDEGTVGFAPMDYVRTPQDMRFLAEAIVKADPGKAFTRNMDPFWDEAAISLLCAEMALSRMRSFEAGMADVLELHDSMELQKDGDSIKTSLDSLFNALRQEYPHCFAVTNWLTFSTLPIKTAGCVFSTLNTTLDAMFPPSIRAMMSGETKLDLRELGRRRTLLFITTSPVSPALNCLAGLFYSTAFKELFECAEAQEDGALPVPVRMVCDDFATGGRP